MASTEREPLESISVCLAAVKEVFVCLSALEEHSDAKAEASVALAQAVAALLACYNASQGSAASLPPDLQRRLERHISRSRLDERTYTVDVDASRRFITAALGGRQGGQPHLSSR
jgi:hypothetical protein